MPAKFPRREFLRSTLAASAGGLTIPYWFGKASAAAEPKSKNDRFRLALIGCGERGMDIGQHAASFGDYVAIVDVDRKRGEAANAHFGEKADVYQDYRHAIDRKDIDAVICAVPDHWHTAINIAVCKSGKDLYTGDANPMTGQYILNALPPPCSATVGNPCIPNGNRRRRWRRSAVGSGSMRSQASISRRRCHWREDS